MTDGRVRNRQNKLLQYCQCDAGTAAAASGAGASTEGGGGAGLSALAVMLAPTEEGPPVRWW